MHRDSSKELATLKVEQEQLKWELSDLYILKRERESSRMGYTYGDHTKGKS